MNLKQINILYFRTDDTSKPLKLSGDLCPSNFCFYTISNDSAKILDYLEQTDVDVVLIDINSNITKHISLLKEMLKKQPHLNLLLYTSSSHSMDVLSAFRIGVKGFMVKPKPIEEIYRSIQIVSSGNVVIDESLAPALQASLQKPQQQHVFAELTHRENHITWLVAQGLKNKDIADECGISEKTVRNTVSKALKKLGFADRRDIIKELRLLTSEG